MQSSWRFTWPIQDFGVSVDTLTPQLAQQLGLPSGLSGVAITDVERGSAAEETGIRAGDVIEQFNRKPVSSVNEFMPSVRGARNKPVLLLIGPLMDNRQACFGRKII